MGGQWAGVARLRYDGFIDSGAAALAAPGGLSDVPAAARVHCLSWCSRSRLGLAGRVSFGDGIAAGVGTGGRSDCGHAPSEHTRVIGRRTRRSDGDAHHRADLNHSQFHADNHPNFPAAFANTRRRTGARPVHDAGTTPAHAHRPARPAYAAIDARPLPDARGG